MLKVLLVRHADIDLPRASPDPPLNAAGDLRARALAHVAMPAGVTKIFASGFVRTKQTVEPVARRLGLQPREAPDTLIDELLASPAGTVVLIAGHSNTIPEMIAALGVTSPLPNIAEPDFDNLFVVTTSPATRQAALIHLKYGKDGN